MSVALPLLPPMVTIPAGVFNGVAIESFQLGRTPVTNAEYAAHVDRHHAHPFVLLGTTAIGVSLICRAKKPSDLVGLLSKDLPENWDTRRPRKFGVLTLFELRKDLSPKGFDRSIQPVVNISWFHAFEYCVGNGLFLPTDDQWEYAARGPEGHEYGTRSGKLTEEEANYDSRSTTEVGSYPPNGFGLTDMTGNVWEWTAYAREGALTQRGGSWKRIVPATHLEPAISLDQSDSYGFRVCAPLLFP